MNEVCDIPGASLAVERAQFPDAVFDPPADLGVERETAVLAGGCFWCVEAVFRELQGVVSVTSGYSGGSAASANYDRVCSGTTAHAEVVSVEFDPHKISFAQLLKVFFAVAHDPTQVDRQGNDQGRQYRSAIFFGNDRQRDAAKVFSAPIATEVVALDTFHVAEAYHQNYAELHPEQGYIAAVAAPKVAKLRKQFAAQLKR